MTVIGACDIRDAYLCSKQAHPEFVVLRAAVHGKSAPDAYAGRSLTGPQLVVGQDGVHARGGDEFCLLWSKFLHRKDIRMVASYSDDGLWVGPPVAQVGRYHANDGAGLGPATRVPRQLHGDGGDCHRTRDRDGDPAA